MKFHAAVLVENRQPLVIEEIELNPLRFGQVLIKVLKSGVCGSQINEIYAVKGADKHLPHLLGHEASAIVVECGEGVNTVARDDLVICHWRPGSGIASLPPKYKAKRGTINAGWVTTFNEYAVVSENRITRVPDDFDLEVGSLMGCAITTARGVINNDAHVNIGDSVIVFGAGGLGINIIQFAKLAGAYPIVAIDINKSKLELAKRFGASHTIDSSSSKVVDGIHTIAGNNGFDVAIETTGIVDVIELSYKLTSNTGRTILVGVPPAEDIQKPSLYTLPLHFNKVLTGSHGGSSKPDIDIPKIIRLMQANIINFDGLVSKRYSLENINDAINDLRNGNIQGRCILNIGDQ